MNPKITLLALFLTSLFAASLPAAGACPNLAGPWTVTENATTVIIINGSPQPTSAQSGTGTIDLTQTGCTATCCQDVYNPNTGTTEHVCRVGTISGNTVTFTGIAMLPVPGLTFSRNSMVAVGTISPDGRRIDATTTVDVAFTGAGISGTVTGGGTQVFVSKLPPLTITTTSPLLAGTVGIAYNQNLAATGATTPYTWSIASGSLPSGLSLSSGGEISGTPNASATANFTVQVTGNNGLSSTKAVSLTIDPGPLARIAGHVSPNGHFVLSWIASQGKRYQLQYKTNLTQTNWINLGSTITASNTILSTTTAIGSDKQRFFRVLLQ